MNAAGRIPSGTVTFLFTDIEGSTRLWESDVAAMGVALAAHDDILRSAIESHDGTVFKTVGDAFCAAFSRPEDALAAAIDLQHRLVAREWPAPVGRIRVRAGLHTGSALESGGDYFGPTVNRVARLMSIGYGEQILVSGATASLLRDVLPGNVALRDLGTHRLKDLSQPEATYQVVSEGLRVDFPALRSVDARPNNLPYQISSFVGRDDELREVRERLAERRLVTIVGPGGIGKTRLAVHVAADVIDDFDDGVWVVRLSPLRDAALIAQATADVLGVREESQTPLLETLVAALGGQTVLLLFDSAEHLVAATASLVKTLLNRCSRLKVLVTSREPLHITGERVVRIEALQRAADLFVERAREVAPNLSVDDAAMATIGEICRRVDGIPLAIELAAARSATMPLRELNARLSQRLSLLTSRDSTKEERHRTLRGTIAWSDGLLDAADAAVFHSLAVFHGPFGIAAVAAVTEKPEQQLLDVMEALVEKSLIALNTASTSARYVVSDMVREYLHETVDAGTLEHLRSPHFAYYQGVVRSTVLGDELDAATWLETIDGEIGDVRAALEWGLAHEPEQAATVSAGLSRYWKIRGYITEGRGWFRRFLSEPRVTDTTRAAILRRASTFATEQDDYDEARALIGECRMLYERQGDVGGIGEALHNLGVIEQRCGEDDVAAEHYASAIARFREVHHDAGEVKASLNLALLAFEREDLDEAQRRIDDAAAAAARARNDDLSGQVSWFRGVLALHRGELDEAAGFGREVLALKRQLGNRIDQAEVSDLLAVVYARQRKLGEAAEAARETLRIALDLELDSLAINGLEAFCEIATYDGRLDDAALYYGLSEALRTKNSYRTGARKMREVEAMLRAQLGDRLDPILASCAQSDWRVVATKLVESD